MVRDKLARTAIAPLDSYLFYDNEKRIRFVQLPNP